MLPTTTAKGLERQDRDKDNVKFIDSSRPSMENGAGNTSDIAPGSNDDGHHELFDLDLRHVLSVSGNRTGKEYYRGPNPHSHTGDSENYFIVMEDPKGDTVAVDWKRGDPQVYYAFQWLLVKNGYHDVRNVRDSGTGYTAEEQYYAWIEAKRRGLISDECTMPRRAFNHHVVTEGYIEQSDLIESDDYRGKELPQGMFKELAPRVVDDFEFVTGYEPRFRDQNQEPETEGVQEAGSSLLPPRHSSTRHCWMRAVIQMIDTGSSLRST